MQNQQPKTSTAKHLDIQSASVSRQSRVVSLLLLACACSGMIGLGSVNAFAQDSSTEIGGVQSMSNSGSNSGAGEMRTRSYQGNKSVLGGPGYFTTSVGAGFSGGLSNDSTMLDLGVGYNIDYGPQLTGKALLDMNLATGADTSRFIDVAIGANYFPSEIQLSQVRPYIGGDAGVGFVRTTDDRSAEGLAVAGTVGFQMLTSQTNIDVNLRYELLTQQIAGNNPQVLGLKIGMNY